MSSYLLGDLTLNRWIADRDAASRLVPDLIAHLLREPSTAVLTVRGATLAGHISPDGRAALEFASANEAGFAAAFEAGSGDWFYLGRDSSRAYLAWTRPENDTDEVTSWVSLRDHGHVLTALETGLATSAVALAAWCARHQHCPRCGAATELVEAGWAARCIVDSSVHYPRTDPAVIMAVHDSQDRLLLAHSALWPANRRSILAGFVEAGESPEAAVRREVREEVSLAVERVVYAGSQPWPFPGSLMLGYRAWLAESDGGESDANPQPDGVEITDASFFTREELAEAVTSGRIGLPMQTSIARALIEDWYGGPIPGA